MKQQFYLVDTERSTSGLTKTLNDFLAEGWIPEKTYSNDNSFMVLLSLEEEGDEERKPGELDDAESLISVPIEEVDAKLEKGYVLLDRDHIYAKVATLVKRKAKVADELVISEIKPAEPEAV